MPPYLYIWYFLLNLMSFNICPINYWTLILYQKLLQMLKCRLRCKEESREGQRRLELCDNHIWGSAQSWYPQLCAALFQFSCTTSRCGSQQQQLDYFASFFAIFCFFIDPSIYIYIYIHIYYVLDHKPTLVIYMAFVFHMRSDQFYFCMKFRGWPNIY